MKTVELSNKYDLHKYYLTNRALRQKMFGIVYLSGWYCLIQLTRLKADDIFWHNQLVLYIILNQKFKELQTEVSIRN